MSTLEPLAEVDLGQPLGQCRAAPVTLAPGEPEALLLAYGVDQDIDPFMGMFFFPTDSLKLALWQPGHGIVWRREMHRGVVPGMWFCPILPFDLNGDGTDELYMVVNQDPDHPLDIKKYKLERIDPATGRTNDVLPWRGLDFDDYTASQRYRHFLAGGYAGGRPVLACVQGTYTRVQFQGMRFDGSYAWENAAAKGSGGARASHNCPVVDFDQDGDDELFIGERCIRLRDGKPLFVADEHVYDGHSDVIAPVWDAAEHAWSLFTARETPYANPAPPRVVMFGPTGRRRWTDLEEGHMDMGWVARLAPEGRPVAYAFRLGGKRAGPQGFERTGGEELFWDPSTGQRVEMGVSAFERVPVDVDGDGLHELAPGPGVQCPRDVIDGRGRVLAQLPAGSRVAHASKLVHDSAGEQLVAYQPDGRVQLWGQSRGRGEDAPAAHARYAHPMYQRCRKLTAVGYNACNLGGI